ncbi:hypothetical protein VNI00_018613 [Paramarasmius palmivorus]|uniref:Nephrocystin 3-like N-terminal domain-containing protein n=1 Tax=Paramarasmius palmivorus TaxID=297713 RepID=A0AAW0AVK9_9AGAR
MSFSYSQGISITGDVHNVVHGDQINNPTYNFESSLTEILRSLTEDAALNALHNSEHRFPPPNCLSSTRTKILADCSRWISVQTSTQRVFWIRGRAGVGKSAITQNVCEKHTCKGELLVGTRWPWHVCLRNQAGENVSHRFAAGFFFSRNDPTRDKLDPLVVTIIYQFLTSEPLREVLGPSIIEALALNPGIFRLSFEDQFRKLIIEPCSKVEPEVWNNLPNVVVIDGLDECILIPSQERLAAMIREAIMRCHLIFLVTSRPEPRICRAFDHEIFTSLLYSFDIRNSIESSQDITTFFHHRFAQLQDTRQALRHIDVSWPGEDAIRKLVERACGQFIFAATVMKYLESDDDDPTERLEDILRIRADDLPESPYPDLDLFYRQILSKCSRWDDVRKVLRLLVTPSTVIPTVKWKQRSTDSSEVWCTQVKPCSTKHIMDLYGFKASKVETLLFRLHAVIEVPEDNYENMQIAHTSFTEFLLDASRSGVYLVEKFDRSEYLDLVAQAFFRTLVIESQEVCQNLWYFVDLDVHTSFMVFDLVCTIGSPSDALLTALDRFDPYSFVSLLLYTYLPWELLQFEPTVAWAQVRVLLMYLYVVINETPQSP